MLRLRIIRHIACQPDSLPQKSVPVVSGVPTRIRAVEEQIPPDNNPLASSAIQVISRRTEEFVYFEWIR